MPDVAEPEVKDVPVSELYADKPAAVPEPVSTPVESTEPESTSTEPEAVATPTLKDRVAELGFKDVTDDNEAQQRLIEAYQQQQANQQAYQQQMEMLRMQMAMAQQKPAAPNTPDTPAPQGWWNAPKTNEQYRQQFIAGKAEDGSIQWKPNTPPQILIEHEQEQAFYADWANKLVHNPDQALKPFEDNILAAVERKIQETLQQHTQRQQTESFVQQQIRENEDVLYQKDPITKEIRRDFKGEAMLSEAGVRFDSILAELANSGMQDEQAMWRYAQQIYKAQYGDLRQQASQKIQQARAAHVAQTMPAAHVPARNGQDVNGRTNGGRPHMQSFGERFLAVNDMTFQ